MDRKTKLWLVIAASLVLVGMIALGCVGTALHWNFTGLSAAPFETKEHLISEDFSSISVNTDTADLVFVPSDGAQCKVVCYQPENATHSVSVTDGTLVIEVSDTRNWYEYIGFQFQTPKVTVYLPETEYAALSITEDTGNIAVAKDFQFKQVDLAFTTGDVEFFASALELMKIKATTGNIRVEGTTAGALELSASTGMISVADVRCEGDANIHVTTGKTDLTDLICENLTSEGDTGTIRLENVVAAGQLCVERSTGDVRFDGSDAAEIFVETDTGDVTGSFLTDKVFIVETDTGRVDVPKTITGGRCQISTDTGDIRITVE